MLRFSNGLDLKVSIAGCGAKLNIFEDYIAPKNSIPPSQPDLLTVVVAKTGPIFCPYIGKLFGPRISAKASLVATIQIVERPKIGAVSQTSPVASPS